MFKQQADDILPVTSVEFSNNNQGSSAMCLLPIDSDTYTMSINSIVVHDNSQFGLDERSNSQARVTTEVSSITSHSADAQLRVGNRVSFC